MAEYTYEKSEKLSRLIKWQPYSNKTFEKARKEIKPVYLVISAVWCHWCHVYESRKFLYAKHISKYINDNFIPVLVDNDQRPDLAKQYLEGGWPSTTILTPQGQRIFGFSGPPQLADLERAMKTAVDLVKNKRYLPAQPKIEYPKKLPQPLNEERIKKLGSDYVSVIFSAYDDIYGGFGQAHKFPQPRSMEYLLYLYEKNARSVYLRPVEKTLLHEYTTEQNVKSPPDYHLLDPVGGGFHRYSTKRDFTSPHYEKLLGDNAKMLSLYAHFYYVNRSAMAREVVEKTTHYLFSTLYDKKTGAFFGSQDADEYYFLHTAKERARMVKPYVDRTIYLDFNCEAVFAFFELYRVFKKKEHLKTALGTLDFLIEKMLFEDGSRHYYGVKEKKARLQGQLNDNAHLLLACIAAHQKTQKTVYLETAKKIADFCVEHLYDDQNGGFFERNSQDKDSYAGYEMFLPNKPYAENGMMVYALLLLCREKQARKNSYLNAAKKTMALLGNYSGYLDDAYYFAKAADIFLEDKMV